MITLERERRAPQPPSASALLLLAAFVYLVYQVHEVLVPFALSFALAYLVNPVLNHFQARGLKRDHLVLAIYLVIAVTITATANWILPALTNEFSLLQNKIPAYFKQAQEIMHSFQLQAARHLPFGQSIVESWSLKLYDPLVEQLPKLPSYILGLFPLFSLLFLVPFISFYLMADTDNILQDAIQFCPSRQVEQALHIISEVDTSLGNYVRGILIIVLALGATSYIGLKALGVDYALAVATLAGISSLIPYLGAVLGAVVGALVAFFQFDNWSAPLRVVLLFALIRLADEALLQPLVSKHAVRLHPLLYLLSLMVGGKLFGFVGLIFAVPAACVIKALLRVAWDWYVSESRGPMSSVDATVPYC
ncbi:MAG TPA: AI-2E family transporter [Elusimicrobiota bacterium]|nr:AI-2E family transporter [Elusimicrobiota bacterium]